jgi:hypothetical protein
LNIDNNLEEVGDMTRKALLICAAIVVAVLFPFTSFPQEQEQVQEQAQVQEQTQVQEQEEAKESVKKTITYSDLQAQNKKIEGLRNSYAQVKAEYDAECTGKSFKAGDEGLTKCTEKSEQLTKINSQLKKESEAYKKNVAEYKASVQSSPDAIGPSSQGKKTE